jgi:hypothetical protein
MKLTRSLETERRNGVVVCWEAPIRQGFKRQFVRVNPVLSPSRYSANVSGG